MSATAGVIACTSSSGCWSEIISGGGEAEGAVAASIEAVSRATRNQNYEAEKFDDQKIAERLGCSR